MLSLEGTRSHGEPNPGGQRETKKTTDEKASRQTKLVVGDNPVKLVYNHKETIFSQRRIEDEAPRPALALDLAANAPGPTKRKGKCRKNSSVKRHANRGDNIEEESSSDQPSKRKWPRITKNQEPNKASLQPFACPSFRHNKTQNAECRAWHNVKLSQVKQHCIEIHVKPFRCGRCRVFRAGTLVELNKHLVEGDCKKRYIPDPSEKDAIVKAGEIEKAKTWERIYEVLNPQIIPDPFYAEKAQDNLTDHDQRATAINSPPDDVLASEYDSTIISSQEFDLPGEDLYLLGDELYFLPGFTFPPLE